VSSPRCAPLLLLLASCTTSSLPPLPGEYLGSYHFQGNLVVDASAGPTTNCLLDGGLLFWPSIANFYAQMSWVPDAGVIFWQIQNGPLIKGTFSGPAVSATTLSPAQVSNCGCVGEVTEIVSLVEVYDDAGTTPPVVTPPALYWAGLIQDELAPNPNLPPVCEPDAGPGCGLNCQLVYSVLGVPGLP
jgi:hypothetical protein